MKNKHRVITITVILFCLLLFYLTHIAGWMTFYPNTDTQTAFLNNTIVSREQYTKDSNQIIQQLRKKLLAHKGFFEGTAYDDETQLIIDSILYSPDFKKLGILLIAQNPESKQILPDKRYVWYYNATCFLAIREGDTLRVKFIGPGFTNSHDRKALSDILRQEVFRNFARNSTHKYNLNDTRFWASDFFNDQFNQ
ncbi:hypothetical protein [Chitinophaga sp. Cy-1792]|uniref:hypothetical protein n=1 Tax=Chitinophaga sp. Cy-1792 TaxID=2608339 RepID=UPI0014200E10|nr:hypothetical protein [Chitinophaga sp. Cy-1792]NIG55046.1 hypothetical protein [Chitinophaga sp. Cy-1792]